MTGGLVIYLDALTGQITTVRPGVLRLYTNNITPLDSDIATRYTECTLAGYSPIALQNLTWTTRVAGGVAFKAAAPVTYVFNPYSGPQITVYGSYCTVSSTGQDMYYASPFSTPFRVSLAGDRLQVVPAVSLRRLP